MSGFGGFDPHPGMTQVLIPNDLLELVGAVLQDPGGVTVGPPKPVRLVQVGKLGFWLNPDRIVALIPGGGDTTDVYLQAGPTLSFSGNPDEVLQQIFAKLNESRNA